MSRHRARAVRTVKEGRRTAFMRKATMALHSIDLSQIQRERTFVTYITRRTRS